MSTQADFDAAIVNVTKLKKTPSDNERLKLYGLFKQGKGEDFSKVTKPSAYQFEAKYKYAAWEEVKDLTPEDAQKQYIDFYNELKEKYGLKQEEQE